MKSACLDCRKFIFNEKKLEKKNLIIFLETCVKTLTAAAESDDSTFNIVSSIICSLSSGFTDRKDAILIFIHCFIFTFFL